jgi:hypothetical protein
MSTLEIKGDWNITQGNLKQKWASLPDGREAVENANSMKGKF